MSNCERWIDAFMKAGFDMKSETPSGQKVKNDNYATIDAVIAKTIMEEDMYKQSTISTSNSSLD